MRPIKLTESLIEETIAEFRQKLTTSKLTDGKFSYSTSFSYSDAEKATVRFTPLAYSKMVKLLMEFSTEVGWYGVGRRLDSPFQYEISDILVYPQSVNGAYVDMDEQATAQWLYEHEDDERFYNLVMQGHSHVNMSPTPSGTDLEHQATILKQIPNNGFYIFMIWNKKLERNIRIYDLQHNVMFDPVDVNVVVGDDDFGLDDFLKESKEMVKNKTYQSSLYGNKSYPNYQQPAALTKKSEPTETYSGKAKPKAGLGVGGSWNGRGYNNADNCYDNYGYDGYDYRY